MAATPEQVRGITGSTLDDATLQPFLDAAACIMERVEACIVAAGVTESCRDQAEAWLASHLLTTSSVGSSSATVKKETFESYSVERIVGEYSGKGVLGTTYGLTANSITGGCLQEVDKAPALIAFFG